MSERICLAEGCANTVMGDMGANYCSLACVLRTQDKSRGADAAPPSRDERSVMTLFHMLWTRAVGAPDYVKRDWQDLGNLLDEMFRKAKPAPSEAGRQEEWQPRTPGERLSYEQGHKDARLEAAARDQAREAEIRALIAKWRGFADEAARNGVPSALVKSMAIEACANHLESLLTPASQEGQTR